MAYKEKANAIRYNNEFIKQTYDRVNLVLPKGRKDTIQTAAAARGESLNGFITAAINDRMAEYEAVEAVDECNSAKKHTEMEVSQ